MDSFQSIIYLLRVFEIIKNIIHKKMDLVFYLDIMDFYVVHGKAQRLKKTF